MLLLLLRRFSRVRLCATPQTAAHQAPPSLGFSRQGHWLLLLLSRFSRVQLCATPQTAAHQAPPSLGFSRQEHWRGLPFPSPMHASESEVAQSCPTAVLILLTKSLLVHGARPACRPLEQTCISPAPVPGINTPTDSGEQKTQQLHLWG